MRIEIFGRTINVRLGTLALTGSALAIGSAVTLAVQSPAGAQSGDKGPQNAPATVPSVGPGGAPRSFAILNGTLAASIGLGLRLWLAGLIVWLVGHTLAVWVTRKDPAFLIVLSRHARHKGALTC